MLEKVFQHKLSQLRERIIDQRFPVGKWKVKELLYIEPIKYRLFSHKTQRVNQMSKESVIAQTGITLPSNMVNKKVYIRIPALEIEKDGNVEALLILNNKPLAGIDLYHTVILLAAPSFSKTTTNLRQRFEKGIYLFTVNPEIEKYYFNLNVAYEIFENSQDNFLKAALWKIMEDSVSEFDIHTPDFKKGINNARQIFSEGLSRLNKIYKPMGKISLIAHSHLDIAWRWKLKET